MKLLHLSDLHLGKRVNEFSMIEDQKYILNEILKITDEEKPDAVLIAGDVYDKSIPPAEAVELFDDFLVCLSKRSPEVFVISGNHDSPERLSFGGRLMETSGIHMSPVFDGKILPFSMEDEFGKVNIYMLPFIKPANVRRFFEDEEIKSYTDAIRTAIDHMDIDESVRNVIVTHQFVTGADRCESEEVSVGGSDNVDEDVFSKFDYTALGHIHGPQNIGSEKVRYCGTPLKYSFSEASHKKSVTIAELKEKGSLEIQTVPLVPIRDMVKIKGTYEELTLRSFYKNTSYGEDYMHITLTDEEDVPNALSKLRVIYKNLMKLEYDNKRTRSSRSISDISAFETRSPEELFGEFYEQQNGGAMSEEQSKHIRKLIEDIWEERE